MLCILVNVHVRTYIRLRNQIHLYVITPLYVGYVVVCGMCGVCRSIGERRSGDPGLLPPPVVVWLPALGQPRGEGGQGQCGTDEDQVFFVLCRVYLPVSSDATLLTALPSEIQIFCACNYST